MTAYMIWGSGVGSYDNKRPLTSDDALARLYRAYEYLMQVRRSCLFS